MPTSCSSDTRTDLAVLRIKGAHERFPALDFGDSDKLQVGDVVLAIGNPFGVGQTVTHGIVSALARTQVGITDYQFFIQTDAADQSRQFRRRAGRSSTATWSASTPRSSRAPAARRASASPFPANMVRVVVASAKGGSNAVQAAVARRQAAGR